MEELQMNKVLLTMFFILIVALSACSPAAQEALEENEQVEQTSDNSAAADTNNNGVADIEVEATEDTTEVTIDFDDVQDEATQEAVEAASGAVDFCVPGETYTYESEEGSVDSEIIGLAMYKGSEWCQAESVTEIESPVGTITTNTIYYFDNTYKEYWVVAVVSSPMMPEPQTSEVHIVDGEVQ